MTTAPFSIQPADSPKKKGFPAIVIWIAVLVAFGLLFWWVLFRKEQPAKAGGRRGFSGPVTTIPATVEKGNIDVDLPAIGTVTPVYTASITPQVNGVVMAVHFVEGQIVKVGDPLIDIDPRPYEATLLQAQGILERDQGVLAQARMDFERYLTAWSRNAIAKQTLDDQEKIVQQNQGTVKNDLGTVEFDKLQVAYCHITAPIAGRVGLRLVDPGNVVQSSASGSSPLVVITQVQPITVVFTVAEDKLGPVLERVHEKVELPVTVFDRTKEKKLAAGKLLALDNQIDTTTGTVKVRAVFDNKDEALFPNQFVNTVLLVNTLEGVILVPSSAIQQNDQTFFVYVLKDEQAHKVEVKPGITNGGVTQVESVDANDSIHPNDIVANSSFEKLLDGSKVIIADPNAPAGKGSHGGGKHGGKNPNGKGGDDGKGGKGGSGAP